MKYIFIDETLDLYFGPRFDVSIVSLFIFCISYFYLVMIQLPLGNVWLFLQTTWYPQRWRVHTFIKEKCWLWRTKRYCFIIVWCHRCCRFVIDVKKCCFDTRTDPRGNKVRLDQLTRNELTIDIQCSLVTTWIKVLWYFYLFNAEIKLFKV